MNTNEAPEKLFIKITHPISDEYTEIIAFEDGDGIEYTRTDAFIEKALAYLNEKFYFNNLHYAVENNSFNCMEEMFDNFKKYMKGE